MVCDVVEMALGVGMAWARRDGVGVVVAAAVPSALSMLTALVPVDVAVPSSTVPAAAFALMPSSALSASPFVASDCAC